MTVRSLLHSLIYADPDAEVFLSAPFGKDEQEYHVAFGARYVVNDHYNGRVWFETYGDENITEEVNEIISVALETGMSDEDYVDTLFDRHEHGYTLADIKANCSDDIYQWLLDNEYRKEMYPEKDEGVDKK